MLIGYLVVWLGVLFAFVSMALYACSRRVEPLRKWARWAFIGAFLMILAAEGVLQYALITGRYELQYVFSFSERALPLWYKIAGRVGGSGGQLPAVGDLDRTVWLAADAHGGSL
jgi:cytochrome c-type biogenesis protein CcmF